MGFPEGIPKPQLELPDAIGTMQAECQRAGSVTQYVEQLRRRYAGVFSVRIVERLADFIEPVVSGEDDSSSRRGSKAFFQGALFGMRLAKEAYGDEADELLEYMKVEAPDLGIGGIELQHKIGELLMECGDRGASYAPQYEDMIDEWSDLLCEDASHRHFVKRGFGIVVFGMKQYAEGQAERDYLKDLGIFEESIASIHDYDWDAHFDELDR